jgi:autotransporter adhesin
VAYDHATAVGTNALVNGNYAVVIGSSSQGVALPQAGLYSIAIGAGNDGDGPGARANDTFGVAIGTGAFAVGVRSTSVGAFAGFGSTAAGNHRNSFFGEEAGQNVTGGGNTAAGLAAGHTVTGNVNSAFGNSAGQAVTGNNNLAAGALSGTTVKGSYNVAYGDNAGRNVTGNNNVAIGRNSGRTIAVSNTTAIGTNARATAQQAIAIGYQSIANVANTVSIGSAGGERRIMNVAAAVKNTDAVNLKQVKQLIAAASASPAAVAAPVAPEPPAVSVVAVGPDNARHSGDDIRRELAELRALVRQQQQRIAQLESRVASAR